VRIGEQCKAGWGDIPNGAGRARELAHSPCALKSRRESFRHPSVNAGAVLVGAAAFEGWAAVTQLVTQSCAVVHPF